MNWDPIYHETEKGIGVESLHLTSMAAGPSSITLDDLERMESDSELMLSTHPNSSHPRKASSSSSSSSVSSQELDGRDTRRRPRRRHFHTPKTLVLAQLLAVAVPTAYAAPPPTRRQARAVPTPTFQPRTRIAYPVTTPPISSVTSLPMTLDERRLPYVLTQLDDGSWSKIDNAWSLYGRQAGNTEKQLDGDAVATSISASATFAVADALPTGWGATSSRTSIYRIPLIAVASCVLAVVIVVITICITLNRRKAHRKAKRQAERLRRKALLAAGLTEESVNGSAAEAAFKEKLAELEKQHRSKKRGKESSFVRTKVKRWNAGLRRRRKPKGGDGDEDGDSPQLTIEVIESKTDEIIEVPTTELRRQSTESVRSTPSAESARPSSERSSDSTPTSHHRDSDEAEPPRPNGPYFPPAYRPASVRSLRVPSAPSPSASSHDNDADTSSAPSANITEKTTAPGYYPAPATEESELALAVASRSDGKQRMPASELENDQETAVHMRHIATDDKLVLEQMRLGASEPPRVSPTDESGESGPSAPHVEVDEQGFERVDVEHLTTRSAAAEPSLVHPDIPAPPPLVTQRSFRDVPAPPQLVTQRSFQRISMDEHDVGTHEQLDALQLLPSAPPGNLGSNAPSAPPLALDQDDEEEGVAPVASAPLLNMYGEHLSEEGIQGEEDVNDNDTDRMREEEGDTHVEERIRAEVVLPRPVFLPRYEP
ncbi:hypothetical protein BCR39DRAFT_278855 [Naematelia encephala]|uniref:Transmembrane protein n=1 Tax=Naematelia encephala TaxID=71784 RepID=A0A1Y2ATH7_9TREE|nr:hypothetical protein BCR39DRAFT_278855 [Naematelia encephala]